LDHAARIEQLERTDAAVEDVDPERLILPGQDIDAGTLANGHEAVELERDQGFAQDWSPDRKHLRKIALGRQTLAYRVFARIDLLCDVVCDLFVTPVGQACDPPGVHE